MDFNLTEEQTQLKAMIGKFVQDEVKPVAGLYDKKLKPEDCIPFELIEKAMGLGLGKMALSKEFGGLALTALDIMVVIEELAKGDAGFADTIIAHTHWVHLMMKFGTETQKKHWFTLVTQDKTNRLLGGIAISEPQSGSDSMSPNPAAGIKTTAVLEGGCYVLNGCKCYITNAGLAKAFIVWARTDKTKGAYDGGTSAFVVASDTPGLKVGKIEDKLGLRLSQQGELIFDNCKIPVENLLGEVGMGHTICAEMMPYSFTGVGAVGVGIAEAAYEHSYEYSKTRVQNGTEIINYQGISNKIADMLIQIEAARLLVQKSAFLIDSGAKPDYKLAAICKLFGSEVAFKAASEAVQILGRFGYSKEYPVEKLLRDSKALSIYETGNESIKANMIFVMRMREGLKPGFHN